MNKVEPIKKVEDIEEIKKILKERNVRDYFLFIFSINTGFKLSEILNLKFYDFDVENRLVYINERPHELNFYLVKCFEDFKKEVSKCSSIKSYTYLFKGKKGERPINRSHVYRVLNNAAKQAGIEMSISSHTLRKTYGYHYYVKHNDIKYLQKFYKHSTSERTKKYIGVTVTDKVKKREIEL